MLSPSLEVSQVHLDKALGNSELDEKCSEDSSSLGAVISIPHNS